MIIYNPPDIITERIKQAEKILKKIKAKHCFISGSFLYKKDYNDIDLFIITRSKKNIEIDKKIQITIIDFNNLHSLFYHSLSLKCISKSILPKKELKVTLSDYWKIINQTLPELINNKKIKDCRDLILYTEYLKNKKILDSLELDNKLKEFKNYKEIIYYIFQNSRNIFRKKLKKSYIYRFFYTSSGFFENMRQYTAYDFLYNLCHHITNDKPNSIQEKNTRDIIAKL